MSPIAGYMTSLRDMFAEWLNGTICSASWVTAELKAAYCVAGWAPWA